MFISSLSTVAQATPGLTPLPAFGAMQRLDDPTQAMTSMAAQSSTAQMGRLLAEMFLMLRALMVAPGSTPNASEGAQPVPASKSSGGGSGAVSQSTAPNTDLGNVQGSDFGKKFAAQAEKTANQINTSGLCLKGVNDTMQAMGLPVHREAAAWMAVDDFQKNPKFKEVKVAKDQLKSLPPGAVVIWDKGDGLPYGHISVALGGGREASSKVRQQLLLNTNFHVFLPN